MKKIFFRNLLIIMILSSCTTSATMQSAKLVQTDNQLFSLLTIENFNDLIDNKNILSFNFVQIGNRPYLNIDIYVRTLIQFHTLNLQKIELRSATGCLSLNIDRKYNLSQAVTLYTIDNEHETSNFYTYLNSFTNGIRISLEDIFETFKRQAENDIPIIMIVYYSFDGNEILEKKFLYNLSFYERVRQAPEWMYKIFPGM